MSFKETALSRDAQAFLRERFPHALVRKIGTSPYTHSGTPDLYVGMPPDGRTCWIELKTEEAYVRDATHGLTLGQAVFGRQVLDCGATWGIAFNLEMVLAIVEHGRDVIYRAAMNTLLDDAIVEIELKRSQAAKRRKRRRPMTEGELHKSRLYLRKHNRKYGLTDAEWETFTRPTIEG